MLLGIAGALGLGAATVRRFERAAERDVAARLQGENKKVRLRVSYPGVLSPAIGEISRASVEASHFSVRGLPFLREPWRSSRGRIDRLVVDLRDFELTGLGVAQMTASIPNVRYDLAHAARHGEIRISRAGVGTSTVALRPEAIAAWLMRRSPGLLDVTGRIEDGKLGVKGRLRFSNFEIPFDVLSRVTGEGPRLLLDHPQIRLAGVLTEGKSVDELVRALNPVVDVDRDLALGGAVSIRRVDVRDGLIVASGAVTIPASERPEAPGKNADGATPRR